MQEVRGSIPLISTIPSAAEKHCGFFRLVEHIKELYAFVEEYAGISVPSFLKNTLEPGERPALQKTMSRCSIIAGRETAAIRAMPLMVGSILCLFLQMRPRFGRV